MKKILFIILIACGALTASAGIPRTNTFSWDGKGRLHSATERDANGHGYNWSAGYDALGRRWKTTTYSVTNNVEVTSQPRTILSYFDPLHEFLELKVTVNGKSFNKVYGPDLNGSYGAMQGQGGFDAVAEPETTFSVIISDSRGDTHGFYDPATGAVKWNSSRPTGYGAVPEHRPAALADEPAIVAACARGGRWMDLTGLYWQGARYYDPIAGRFISCDPYGHNGGASLYAFANGDPINYFDPDGRLAKQTAINIGNDVERGNNNFWTGIFNGVAAAYNAARHPITSTEAGIHGVSSLAGQASVDPRGTGQQMWNGFAANFNDPDRASQFMGTLTLSAMPVPPAIQMLRNVDRFTPDVPHVANTGTTLYQAVGPAELADVQANNIYRTVAGQYEGKGFFGTAEEASRFAKGMYKLDSGAGPFTITSGQFPASIIPSPIYLPEVGGNAFFLPGSALPHGPVTVIPFAPIP